MDQTALDDALRSVLEAYGIVTDDIQRHMLLRHLSLVIAKNKTVNLTRITSPEEAIVLHILDSLLLVHACGAAPRGDFVDMGTGGGYPGIPLSIVTGRSGVLVDSVGKKVDAVRDFIEDLGLAGQLSTSHCRIEDLGTQRPHAFGLAVARAVAQTNILVEYAAPLLAVDGRLVIAKANITHDELQAGDAAAEICGLRRVSRETFELPEQRGHREVISYQVVGRPRIRLPRRPGMAKRHPLGL